jgi:hypothetical protein
MPPSLVGTVCFMAALFADGSIGPELQD